MALHAAIIIRDSVGYIFLSPDGEEWLEVDLPPELPRLDSDGASQRATELQNMLEGKTAAGEQKGTIPIRFARRWFGLIAANEGETTSVALYRWNDGEWESVETYEAAA